MAQLPDYTALGERPVPQADTNVVGYQPTVGRELQQAGGQIAGASGAMEQASQIVAAASDRQDAIAALDAGNKHKLASMQLQYGANGFQNKQGLDVTKTDFVSGYYDQLKASEDQLSASLTPSQQRTFQRYAAVNNLAFQAQLLSHKSQATEKFNDDTDLHTLDLAVTQVANNADKGMSVGEDGRLIDANVPFMSSMSQIQGTIKQMAIRKGWIDPATGEPNAIAKVMQQKMVDAAYATRITALMYGVPGSVQPSPYMAEKLFESVSGQLSGNERIQLGDRVLKSVKNVQQRTQADSAIFGGRTQFAPSDVTPGTQGSPPLTGIVKTLESQGQRFGPDGKLLTSSAGAQGEMQVMPATAANPGFGITPARDNSPDEIARVGRDFLGAMTARYGNPALVLAAYNAGPGAVDGWLTKFGDPRSGQISTQDWAEKIPFAETQNYVRKGLKMVSGNPDAMTPGLTANQLKTGLLPIAQREYDKWLQAYPDDLPGAEAVRQRTIANGHMVIENQRAQQMGAYDALRNAMEGTKPDGSDAPQSIDDLLKDPNMARQWEVATPEGRDSILQRFANPTRMQKSDPKIVNDLIQRIGLPDSDPRKISAPYQITDYFGKGLNYTDEEHLQTILKRTNDPELNPLMKKMDKFKTSARRMLVTTSAAINDPDLAEEAASRFSEHLDQQVDAFKKAGKDPHTLFDSTSKDYVLDASRVAAFMPDPSQIAAAKAAKLKKPEPSWFSTKLYDLTGGTVGSPAVDTSIPRVSNAADWDKVQPGQVYFDLNGVKRRKGGSD